MQILTRGFVRTAAAVAAVSVVAAAAGVSLSNGRPPVNQEASEPSTVPRADSRPGQTAQVDRTPLHQAIQLAADYLVRACGPDGKFVYLAYLDPSEVPTGAYNIVRHAGTIYALGMHHQWRPTDAVRDAMVRATGYLKQQAIAPVPGCEEFLAVWQCPDVDSLHKPIRTSLGACGLGLVALVSTEGAAPGTTGIEELRRLGRFLVFLQQEDGCFYHSYIPSRGGVSDRGECLYYPGEAALGLLMLYELDPDPRWLETAAKALGWLARSREDEDSVPADHWALLATAKLMTRHEQCESIISRGQLLTHAVQICQSILEEQRQTLSGSADPECMTGDNRTCPTATRVEGLAAIYPFLAGEAEPFQQRVRTGAAGGLRFLIRSQFREGPLIGGIPGISCAEDHSNASEMLHGEIAEVRIDYVQHAVSAMIDYDRVMPGREREG